MFKKVIELYEKNKLKTSEKYSAECLISMNEMQVFLNNHIYRKLDYTYEMIK